MCMYDKEIWKRPILWLSKASLWMELPSDGNM